MASALGGALDGMLAERVILNATGVVAIPEHMSFAEAATMPCAGLTAWNGLTAFTHLTAGQAVLLLGTGGVSIYALQLAKAMGLRTIITSSSDAKLERATSLGADETINYKQNPEWQEQVLAATNGLGVDLTLETGGAGTLERSIAATKVAGTIVLVGILTGGTINPTLVMRKSIRLQGLYVGSTKQFENFAKAMAFHKIQPVIDQEFTFDQAPKAFETLQAAGHFGKLVINT